MRHDEVTRLLDGAQRAFARERQEAGDGDPSSQQDSYGELDRSGQHPADVASETAELEIGHSIGAEAAEVLTEIASARLRLAAGTYGRCATCGEPIPDERLRAVPWTQWCVRDEARRELDAVRLRPVMDAALLASSAPPGASMGSSAPADDSVWDPEDDDLFEPTEELAVHPLEPTG
jgi:RNA polymerase-binding transcription factor DksA